MKTKKSLRQVDTNIPRLSDCYKAAKWDKYVCCMHCKKVFLNDILWKGVWHPYCGLTLHCMPSKGAAIEAVWTNELIKADFSD